MICSCVYHKAQTPTDLDYWVEQDFSPVTWHWSKEVGNRNHKKPQHWNYLGKSMLLCYKEEPIRCNMNKPLVVIVVVAHVACQSVIKVLTFSWLFCTDLDPSIHPYDKRSMHLNFTSFFSLSKLQLVLSTPNSTSSIELSKSAPSPAPLGLTLQICIRHPMHASAIKNIQVMFKQLLKLNEPFVQGP